METVSPPRVLAIALLFSFCACHRGVSSTTTSPGHAREILTIRTDEGPVQLHVELAITDVEKHQGLMGRTSLAPSAGMAFLFGEPATVGFWMKDTLIPLSIAFWDEQSRIVAIDEMTPCTQEPCPTNGPDVPYRGAVEANAGFFADHGVTVGDTVEWGVPAG
jgi:uncharacterized membrane protein (UPF0127 family)